jgi:hypothetical protein
MKYILSVYPKGERMKYLKLVLLLALAVVLVDRAAEAAEWVPYQAGAVPVNAVKTTNLDSGQLEDGWPVCRYRKTVGWFDEPNGVCHTMGDAVGVRTRSQGFSLLVPSADAAQGWALYNDEMELLDGNYVLTTNTDRGAEQEGWPVCRWRKSVGWFDVENNVCKSVSEGPVAVEHTPPDHAIYIFKSVPDFNKVLLEGDGSTYLSLANYMHTESANGIENNTESFRRAFAAMQAQNITKLFVPAGQYLIDNTLGLLPNVVGGASLYGSSNEISLIEPYPGDEATQIGNELIFGDRDKPLSLYGLYFYNVKFRVGYDGDCDVYPTVYQNNVFINHNTVNATGGIIRESGGCQSRIEGNIFLGSSLPSGPTRPAFGDSQTIKANQSGIIIVDNVFGLDMDDLVGLETGWGESSNWTNLPHKLGQLKDMLGLPSDMGKFFCLLNTSGYNRGHPIVFKGNIVNASSKTEAAQGTDHVLYLKGPEDARIMANYFRGFKYDYVKFSGARNSLVAYNFFDGPGLSLFIENCANDKDGSGKLNELSDLTIYDNRLSPDEGDNRTRFFTHNYCSGSPMSRNEGAESATESNIQYTGNRKYGSAEVGIKLKRRDSEGSQHLIYRDNFTEDGTDLMVLEGEAVFQEAASHFNSADDHNYANLAEYGTLIVPNVPAFSQPGN